MADDFSYASIIVTFNRKQLLAEAVRSVLNQTLSPQFVVIVDNASTDGTSEFLKASGILDSPKVKLLKLSENLGGSGGFYYGLEYVMQNLNVNWVSLSDDDAVYHLDYFERINSYSKQSQKVQAFAGRVEFEDHEIQLGHRKFISKNGRFSGFDVPEKTYKEENFEVDFASFVGLVLSTNLIDKIGLPNKDYFIWFDDLEYSIRIRKFTQIIVLSNAIITHKTSKILHGQKKDYHINWKQYYGNRNRILMIKEHSQHKFVSLVLVVLGQLKNFARSLGHLNSMDERKKAFHQTISSIFDGLMNKKGKNKRYLP